MTSPSSPAVARPRRVGPPVAFVLPGRSRGLAAWSADHASAGPRRRLQIALGLLWLLDAALQFQPYMFSRAFATDVLAASAAGSPALIAGPVRTASELVLHNVAAWNAAFAVTQLALAAGLLWRPAVRAALAGTIVWSLAVWWLGESFGGIFAGAASPLTGAPGAVILYALAALLAWPARDRKSQHAARAHGRAVLPDDRAAVAGGRAALAGRATLAAGRAAVADGSPLGARWSRVLWMVLWVSYAYLTLQGPNRAPGALRATIAGLAAGEPRWIVAMDQAAAGPAGHAGTLIAVLLAAVFAVIGVAVFVPAATRAALTVSIIVALAIWLTGENFGGILTGQATDPNTGPLLVLVAFAFWPFQPRPRPVPGPAA